MKKHFLLSVLISIFSLSILAQSSVKYYRSIDIGTRFNEIRTLNQIDEFTSKFTKCYRIEYDTENRIQDVLFLDKRKPVFDNSNICDLKIEYQKGLEKRTLFDSKGQLVLNTQGVCIFKLQLNDKNYPTAVSNYDIKGIPVEDKKGIARYEWKLDSLGRKISETYWNLKGEQITTKIGVYEERIKWGNSDKDGICYTEISYWTKDGHLLDSPETPPIYITRYDIHGNCIEGKYFGANNQLMANKAGTAIFRNKYDPESGLIREYKYLGVNEQLVEGKRGYAFLTYKYDKQGNQTNVCIFGADEKLKEIKGTAISTIEYNSGGFPVKYRYFGSTQLPKENLKTGISVITEDYDDQGNLVEIKNFGLNGKLKERLDKKIAIYRYKYDSIGNKIEDSTFDASEKLKEDSNGIAITRWKYNEQGNIKEESHYGVDQLLLNKGTSIIRFEYDDRGQLVSTSYLDSNEKLIFLSN